jgi:phosphoribosylformylglycinamidine synthase
VGLVGELPDAAHAGRLGFARAGDAIAIAGEFFPSLGASELAKLRGEPLPGELPAADVARVRAAQEAIRDAVRAGALASAHDIAEGGFAAAVAECCLAGRVGASVDLGASSDPWTHLFGEHPGGGFVVSGPREALDELARRVPLDVFGTVGGDSLRITIAGDALEVPLAELREAHGALAALFP